MFRVYKSDNISFGEPRHIKYMDTSLIEKVKEQKSISLTSEKDKEYQAKGIVESAKELYGNLIEEANIESERIINNARKEIEIKKEEEYEKAYKDGFEKGYAEGKLQANSIIVQAEKIKLFLEERKEKIVKEAEDNIIHMVLDISKKVIHQELEQNQDIIISLVKKAIEKSAYKSEISIKVSSEDYDYVLENKDRIKGLVEGVSEVQIVEDKHLKKGDCILDTLGGQVNSSIDLQIKEIEEAFLFILRNE